MPLQETILEITLRTQTLKGSRAMQIVYRVPPEAIPTPGLNLSAAQKAKLGDRVQLLSQALDENDTAL